MSTPQRLGTGREGRLFTPDIPSTANYPGERMDDGRAIMWLDLEDMRAIAGWSKGDSFEVTDQNTDTQWRVRPAACGADCYCGAFAEPLT